MDDLVICETEIEFGGDYPIEIPSDTVDDVMKSKKKQLGIKKVKPAVGE